MTEEQKRYILFKAYLDFFTDKKRLGPHERLRMIPRDELPEDAADWRDIVISLPRLAEDSARSCPSSENAIFEYVQMEAADLDDTHRSRLVFSRTAQVADAQYWLWTYTESDGEEVFVTYRSNPDGSSCVGLASPNGLGVEQFMLAENYGEVYWS
jgi:hypothetical protein